MLLQSETERKCKNGNKQKQESDWCPYLLLEIKMIDAKSEDFIWFLSSFWGILRRAYRLTFTCSKSAIETLENCRKYVQS